MSRFERWFERHDEYITRLSTVALLGGLLVDQFGLWAVVAPNLTVIGAGFAVRARQRRRKPAIYDQEQAQ